VSSTCPVSMISFMFVDVHYWSSCPFWKHRVGKCSFCVCNTILSTDFVRLTIYNNEILRLFFLSISLSLSVNYYRVCILRVYFARFSSDNAVTYQHCVYIRTLITRMDTSDRCKRPCFSISKFPRQKQRIGSRIFFFAASIYIIETSRICVLRI